MSGVRLSGVERGFMHNEHQQVERPGIPEAFDDFPENNENNSGMFLLEYYDLKIMNILWNIKRIKI